MTVSVAGPTVAVQVFYISICGRMKSVISSIEIENRVVVAKYQRLMVGAKVVLVEKASGRQLPETVTRVASPVPVGALRIRLPDAIEPGTYFLKAFNGHGEDAAQSADFEIG
ncbi:hypothetical protein ABIB75_004430 [Bradyrhizobium sp. GM2.2]|nr:hypothetical protein [Bradyrhizobium canariense]